MVKALGYVSAAIALTLTSLAFASLAHADNHYVRMGATGSATGADWTNAYTSLPSTLVRGDVYYVADGDYGAYSCDDAESGTTVTTIRKATGVDHGSAAGWSDAYGDGQATFPGLDFTTSYWTLDGAVGAGGDYNAYGFAMRTSTSGGDEQYIVISAGHTATFHGITVRHVSMRCSGPANNTGQEALATGTQADNIGMVVQYVYVDDCEGSLFMLGSDWLVEHSYFDRAWSSPEHHGEQIDVFGVDNTIFRYNVIAHCRGTTCIGNGSVPGWNIYGNVFADIQTGNGVIGSGGSDQITNAHIYNNTIVGNMSTSFLYQNNPGLGHGSGNVVENNLFYNSNALFAVNGGGAIMGDHNAFFSSTGMTAGPTDQTGTGDPFVGSGSGNYHLAAATMAGMTLAAPFDTDPDGLTRGADGVWDRGAFELCAGGACAAPDAGVMSVMHDAGTAGGGGDAGAMLAQDAGRTMGHDAGMGMPAEDAGGVVTSIDSGTVAPGSDAGRTARPDASTMVVPDGARPPGEDAGGLAGPTMSGGCGCRVADTKDRTPAVGLGLTLGMAALALLRRVRSRRRASSQTVRRAPAAR